VTDGLLPLMPDDASQNPGAVRVPTVLTPRVPSTRSGTSISQLSNYAQLAVLNWALTTIPMTGSNARPTTWYLGLSLTTPTTSAGGVTEPVGNGYARQAITFSPASGNPGQCTNTALLGFTASGGDWGTVVYGLVYDGLTLGNCWAMGPLLNPKLLQNGDTLQFQPSALAVGIV